MRRDIMKTSTAFNVIQKEADFLGLPFLETCESIKKYRRMVYSPKVVEAFDIVFVVGQKFFEKAE
jgi:hypothetical protein